MEPTTGFEPVTYGLRNLCTGATAALKKHRNVPSPVTKTIFKRYEERFEPPKIARAPHTPLVHRIFESFLAAGCPKPTDFPRKNGSEGVKPFGHGKGSSPKK
jgi:hypothetical protein